MIIAQKNNKIFSPKRQKVLFLAIFCLALIFCFLILPKIHPAQADSYTTSTPGTATWTAPTGVYSVDVEVWGGGGAGGGSNGTSYGGGGGGGGGYTKKVNITVVPNTAYTFVVGAGGLPDASYGNGNPGNESYFINTTTAQANGGFGGAQDAAGAAGGAGAATSTTTASPTAAYAGGKGGNSYTSTGGGGGGGGSSAGTATWGANGANGLSNDGGAGGTAPSGGGDGGKGGILHGAGSDGYSPGGAGGGAGHIASGTGKEKLGGVGYSGQIKLTYTPIFLISGTLYSGEGTGALAGKSIKVAVGTSTTPGVFSTTTTALGAWSVSNVIGLSAGMPIAVWWDVGGVGEKAFTLTKASSTANNITGVDLYQNRVILKHEATVANSTSTTIADLAFCDADSGCGNGNTGDTDIQFTANGGVLNVFKGQELHVWTGDSFLPGGDVTLHGSQGSGIDGDFHLDDNASTTVNSSFKLAGSWYADSGSVFRAGTGTVTFNASTTLKTLAGTMTNSNSFYNLTFNSSNGGSWTFYNNVSTTNTFTITAGTVAASSTAATLLSIGDGFINRGTFSAGTGTVYFTSAVSESLVGNMTNSSSFNNVAFLGAGTYTFYDNASTSNFTISAGTVAASTTAATLFSIGGNYSNSGTFTARTSTFYISSTTAQQTLTGNMIGANAFYNLTILNNSGTDATTSPSVVFSSVASATNFNILTASVKVRFAAASTYTFTNINLNGQGATTKIMLRSSVSGTYWNLAVSVSPVVSYVDPMDSDASSGSVIDTTNGTNQNSGHNLNWFIVPANLVQQSYRFENISNINTGEFIYPKGDSFSDQTDMANTARADVKIGERMFLRVNVQNTGDVSASNKVFKLRFGSGALCPGTCSWQDIGASSAISYASGLLGEMADFPLDATSSLILYPKIATSTSLNWTIGRYAVATSTVDAVTLLGSYQTEFVFALDTTYALPTTQYHFRVYNVTNSSDLDSYTVTPSLTIVSPTSDTKRYSKNVFDAAPANSDASTSLSYFLDNEGYTNLASNDTGTSTIKLTSTGASKIYPQFQISGSKIYYTWEESDGSYFQIWLGSSDLAGTATTTIKLTSTSYIKQYPQLQISGSKIYYTWNECDTTTTCSGHYQIWLATSNLDGTATTTIKLTSTSYTKQYPQFQLSGSKIYYTWNECDITTTCSGYYQTWLATSNLDGTATTTTMLNGTSYTKSSPQLQISGSKIYYTWLESGQIWLGSSNLDGTATTTTKLTSTSYTKNYPQLQISGSKIYYTWNETDDSSYIQIWLGSSNLDGTATTTTKLTSTSYIKQYPQLQISGTKIYYTWEECEGTLTTCGNQYFQTWLATSNLDGTATTTIKLTSTSYTKQYPQFQLSGSKIYYTWLECDGASSICTGSYNQIWLGVQSFGDKLQASNPTNFSPTQMTSTSYTKQNPQLQISGSKIYYTWYECDTTITCNGYNQIWLGSSNLDGTATTTTMLTSTSYNKLYPQLQISGSKIYYTWQETAGSYYQIWLGSSNLDGTATTTVKLTSTSYTKQSPQFQISGSKIYYTWSEYDGSFTQVWLGSSNLNGTATTTTKLTSTSYNKYSPQLQLSGSKIYYTWYETAGSYNQIWLATSNLDGMATTTTMLTSTNYTKNNPQLQISGSKIYYTWYETAGSYYQIWLGSSNLDGTATTTTKLTSTSYDKYYPQLQISGSKIYYTWYECDTTITCNGYYQIWLGTSNLDGTATTTTQLTSTSYTKSNPQLQISGSKIYYTWQECDGASTTCSGQYNQIWLGNNWGYNQFNFREKNSNGTADQIDVSWDGQASVSSTTPTISLQIYNRNATQWETLSYNNTYSTSTDFSLSGSVIADFANYYDSNWWTAFRVTQGGREQYLETDYFSVTFSPAGAASLALSDHPAGQESNKFDIPTGNNSTSSAELFNFKLQATGGNVSVTKLIISLSDIRGFSTANLSVPKIYIDTLDDGAIDAGDTTTVGGTGAVSISGFSGTITFNSQFSVLGSKSYILRIDTISSIDAGDQMTFRLWAQDITLNPIAAVSGFVVPAIHIKPGGISGGGAIGGEPGAGTTRPGGEESGGEEIGSEPGFMPPTSTSGSWNDGPNAYISDNLYASMRQFAYQYYADFGFVIPSGNTIDGIEVKIEAKSSDDLSVYLPVDLSWDSGSHYTTEKYTSYLTTSDAVYTLGGDANNWGRTWSSSEFGSTFRLRVVGDLGNFYWIYIDAIQVKIYNHAGGGTPGGGSEL